MIILRSKGKGGPWLYMKTYNHTVKQWIKWYSKKEEILSATYKEVEPKEFYRELFPEGSLQRRNSMDDGLGNAMVDILVEYPNERRYTRKYTMTDDLEAIRYMHPMRETHEANRLCLCSPVSYYGTEKSNQKAHELFAVVLDLDYVGPQQLKNVIKQIKNHSRCMPPNFLVSSGRGLHLYYLLKEPIPCYKYMIESLTAFKKVLQRFVWNETTSLKPDKPDSGAITQAFRMVGSESKLGKSYPAKAYRVQEERWTIEELYGWVYQIAPSFLEGVDLPHLREPIETYRKRHPLTIEEAKQRYPEWEPGKHTVNRWYCKRDLYDWWIRQIREKAIVGGRYYSIIALAAYGSKCGVPFEEVEKDAMELLPCLEELTDDDTNHFKKKDVLDALRFYRSEQERVTVKLTRAWVSEYTKIDIKPSHREKGKRLKQADHLELARMKRDFQQKIAGTKWTDGNGRKPKQEIVKAWRASHPDGRKADCIRDTGLDKKTVYKWWE